MVHRVWLPSSWASTALVRPWGLELHVQPSGHDLYTRLGVGAFFCWKLNMAGPASHLARWRELSAPYCRTKPEKTPPLHFPWRSWAEFFGQSQMRDK